MNNNKFLINLLIRSNSNKNQYNENFKIYNLFLIQNFCKQKLNKKIKLNFFEQLFIAFKFITINFIMF